MNKKDKDDNSEPSLRKESFEQLVDAAIEAEKLTGVKERSDKTAKRSLIARIFSILSGTVITIVGVIMLIGPGPGLLVTAIGLSILATDVPFARRLRDIVRDRLPQDEQGQLTKKTIITMIVITFLGITLSVISTWIALHR